MYRNLENQLRNDIELFKWTPTLTHAEMLPTCMTEWVRGNANKTWTKEHQNTERSRRLLSSLSVDISLLKQIPPLYRVASWCIMHGSTVPSFKFGIFNKKALCSVKQLWIHKWAKTREPTKPKGRQPNLVQSSPILWHGLRPFQKPS